MLLKKKIESQLSP